MTEIASEGYEDDVYDGLMRKKKGGAEAFLATAEGRDRIKSLLEDHLADVLRTLHSNFFHYTLPTQTTLLSTILPEIHCFDEYGIDEDGVQAESHLIFPPSHHIRHSFLTELTIVRAVVSP